MSGETKVAVLGAGLVLLVSIAMCVGLSDDSPSPRTDRSPPEPLAAAEPELEREAETATEEPTDDEEDLEQAAEGVRTLVGTVSDRRDELLEGAEVMVEGSSRLRDITDRDGAYQLHSVPNDVVTLVVQVTGYAEKRVTVERGEPASEERVDVQLEDGDGVAGMVVDPDGQPVRGAQVSCAKLPVDDLKAETDRFGRFELPADAAGCDGIARHESHADSPRVELRLGAGNLIALALQGSISGVVTDGRGKPVPTFVLALEEFRPAGAARGRRRYRQSHFNPQGRFTVRGLAPGTYVFSVTPRSGQPVRTKAIRVKSGEQVSGIRVVVR